MDHPSPRFWPALTLFFIAPACGELLSGSSPPAEFFNPFSLLVLTALYGSGALLARELCIQWKAGWKGVLLLGAAYGIVEEGLMVKSFFDPNWVDLGVLGSYGRWAGVNWVWSLELTIFHAVFSIAIPILLVELLFPAERCKLWLGRGGMISVSILLAVDVAFGFFFLTPYRPPLIPYLLAAVIAALLYRQAWISASLISRLELPPASGTAPLPLADPGVVSKANPRPLWIALLGFAATLAFFFINWVVPNLDVPAPVCMLATVFLAWQVYRQVGRMSRRVAWGDLHRLALAGGALGFFILLAPLQELDRSRTDNTRGMALVGLATLLFLLWLARRVQRLADSRAAPRG